MKVGKYFMMGSFILCIGLNILLSGCDGSGGAWLMPDEKNTIQTQQVACDTVEMSRSIQHYPISSKIGTAVSLEKTAPKMIKADAPFDYYLKVTNLTDSTITNVIVADNVPVNMIFIDSAYSMDRISDQQVRWKVGTLGPMASAMIETTAIVNGSGTIMSCAEVFYDCPVCAEITILEPKLSFSKAAPKEVLSCDRIELRYLVINNGMTAVCDVLIKETLPEGLLTAEGKDSFEFSVDSLEPDQSVEFSKMVDAIATGKYVSKATLSSSSIKSLESNVTETSVIEPVLTLKESSPENKSPEPGTIFEYVLSNDGQAIAGDVMIMAMLPEGAELSSASDNGKILESDARIVSWRLGELRPNTSKKVTMVIDSEDEFMITPQVVAKANCAHAVAAIRMPELNELTSVSLYKKFVSD